MEAKCPEMKAVLCYAIHAEKEAKEFYRAWADKVDQNFLKKQLLDHAEEEQKHEEELKTYYNDLFGEVFQCDPETVIAPDLITHPEDFESVTSLLRIASSAYLSEMRAVEFYDKQAQDFKDCEARFLFERLRDIERAHLAEAKKRYMKMREDLVGFHAF